QLRATMPPEGGNTLSEAVYVDVVAYLLDANGQGGAAQPLTAASAVVIGGALAARGRGAGPGGAQGAQPQEQPTGVIVAGEVPGFVPISAEALRNPAPGDWPMLRRDYSATSYSPLRQITPANAHLLQLAWIWPDRQSVV